MKKFIDILFNLFCKKDKDMKTYSITEEDDEVDYDYENYPFYEDLIKKEKNKKNKNKKNKNNSLLF